MTTHLQDTPVLDSKLVKLQQVVPPDSPWRRRSSTLHLFDSVVPCRTPARQSSPTRSVSPFLPSSLSQECNVSCPFTPFNMQSDCTIFTRSSFATQRRETKKAPHGFFPGDNHLARAKLGTTRTSMHMLADASTRKEANRTFQAFFQCFISWSIPGTLIWLHDFLFRTFFASGRCRDPSDR